MEVIVWLYYGEFRYFCGIGVVILGFFICIDINVFYLNLCIEKFLFL